MTSPLSQQGSRDVVEIWATMIHQEGKSAALEIVDAAGAEVALDAMEFLRSKYEAEMVRFRDALEAVEVYSRAPHDDIAKACGADACTACLIHGTVTAALGTTERQDG